jgi:putative peptide-modifying radical SAM enzyme
MLKSKLLFLALNGEMFFHVILTGECNSQCKYCYGEALEDFDFEAPGFRIDYSLPPKMAYDVKLLEAFCRHDPDCILTFYGGEPLLCINEMRQVMDRVRVRHFMIQTNGLLLDQLEPGYVNRFHTILVSIDGNEELTDYYRGKGTFKKLVTNLKLIRRNGFTGELIGRMTVMEQTDIYKQVTWLLHNNEFSFTSVHWQLNAGFWKNDFARRDFKRWSEESYNPGIKKLVKFWVDNMEKDGSVLRLYPILGIAQSLLTSEKSQLRCGSGWTNYAIQTDGHIIPCPTMWGMKDYYLGHVRNSYPTKLKKVQVGTPCPECGEFTICGGRCLYTNAVKRWSSDAYSLVCKTVKNLIDAVAQEAPRIKELIERGKVREADFEYMKYNGCEIIP